MLCAGETNRTNQFFPDIMLSFPCPPLVVKYETKAETITVQ